MSCHLSINCFLHFSPERTIHSQLKSKEFLAILRAESEPGDSVQLVLESLGGSKVQRKFITEIAKTLGDRQISERDMNRAIAQTMTSLDFKFHSDLAQENLVKKIAGVLKEKCLKKK